MSGNPKPSTKVPFIQAELRLDMGAEKKNNPVHIGMDPAKGKNHAAVSDLLAEKGNSPNAWGREVVGQEWKDTVITPSSDVSTTVLDGEAILLNFDNGKYYSLNSVGTVSWELFDGINTLEHVHKTLCNRFDVTVEKAKDDLHALVVHLSQKGLIHQEKMGKPGNNKRPPQKKIKKSMKPMRPPTQPLVVDENGGQKSNGALKRLAHKRESQCSSIPYVDLLAYHGVIDRNYQWSLPANEILQFTFFTPEFCSALIETAEAFNEWKPLPNDNVPGQELRLSRISPKLVENIEQHFRWRVGPCLKLVWKGFHFKGFKDLFIIKYSTGGQRSLDLHSDKALITGTVKLNDNFKGGNLEFPRQHFENAHVPIGSMLIWPSRVTHPHRSTEVTAGIKYTLVSWVKE